jgi:DNA-binding response OmpR family regulator
MTSGDKSNAARPRQKILIVDDDSMVRLAIRSVLIRDYDVIEADSIAKGLAAFDQQRPDLVTLDINMPEITGMEGLSYFRQLSPKLPVILISGYATFRLAQEALRMGATDYLTKPFGATELYEKVKLALTKVLFDEEADAPDFDPETALHIPLANLVEEKFLSAAQRSYFLAFAQNALSNKKRIYEIIPVPDLVNAIPMQLKALRLPEACAYAIACSESKLHIECDMYLLGGALANLLLACLLETKSDASPVKLTFEVSNHRLRVAYTKNNSHLARETLAGVSSWRAQHKNSIAVSTAMLILAEKVVKLHHGELNLNPSPPSGTLLEIFLPLQHPVGF